MPGSGKTEVYQHLNCHLLMLLIITLVRMHITSSSVTKSDAAREHMG